MADNGRAKRLKSSSEDGIVISEVAVLRGRIAELESAGKKEVAELQGRITELESEIEQLRRRGRDAGNHEMLPVVVATTVTVDLSHVDSSIVAQIHIFISRDIKRASQPGTHVQIFRLETANVDPQHVLGGGGCAPDSVLGGHCCRDGLSSSICQRHDDVVVYPSPI